MAKVKAGSQLLGWFNSFDEDLENIQRIVTPKEVKTKKKKAPKSTANNRIGNLGIKGVVYRPDIGRFVARVSKNGEQNYIGCFKTIEEASEAYEKAKKKS